MIRSPSNNRGDDLHESVLPVVPFVPFRCPHCGRHKPRTSAVRGRVRSHVCQACGMKYRSLEIDPGELPHWNYRPEGLPSTT